MKLYINFALHHNNKTTITCFHFFFNAEMKYFPSYILSYIKTNKNKKYIDYHLKKQILLDTNQNTSEVYQFG